MDERSKCVSRCPSPVSRIVSQRAHRGTPTHNDCVRETGNWKRETSERYADCELSLTFSTSPPLPMQASWNKRVRPFGSPTSFTTSDWEERSTCWLIWPPWLKMRA